VSLVPAGSQGTREKVSVSLVPAGSQGTREKVSLVPAGSQGTREKVSVSLVPAGSCWFSTNPGEGLSISVFWVSIAPAF